MSFVHYDKDSKGKIQLALLKNTKQYVEIVII